MLICLGEGIVLYVMFLVGVIVTLGSRYSGIHLLIGSESRKCPFSYSVIRATDVIGFVMEAILNIVSVVICLLCCMSFFPWACRYAIFPFLAMSVTVPGIVCWLMKVSMCSCIRFSLSLLNPSSSGLQYWFESGTSMLIHKI